MEKARVDRYVVHLPVRVTAGKAMSEKEREKGSGRRVKKRDRGVKGWAIEGSWDDTGVIEGTGWFAFIGRRTGPRPPCQRYSKCNLHRWRLPAEITNAFWLEQVFYRSLPVDGNSTEQTEREEKADVRGSFKPAQEIRAEIRGKRDRRKRKE